MGDNYVIPADVESRLVTMFTRVKNELQSHLGMRRYNDWLKATKTLIEIEREIEQSPSLHALVMEHRRLAMLASQAGMRISDTPTD